MSNLYRVPVTEETISVAEQLPAVVSGFHVWESGTYRIDGPISSQYGHKRADGAQVYIYGKNLQNDTITYTGGEDGTFTSVTDPGGGVSSTIVTTNTGTIANGDIIFLPETTVYDPEKRYTVSNLVANTSFDIDATFISTDSGTFYKGRMWIDDETATGQENALLRIEGVGLIISGGGRLLDFPDGGNTRGTLWLAGCFVVGDAANYCELGTVANYNFFSLTSIPICISWDDGVCLNDIDQVIINAQMTAWKDNNGSMLKTGTGTFNLFSITGAGSIFKPGATESVLYVNSGATYSQPINITGIVVGGEFFATGSLDETSIYVNVTGVNTIPDSKVAAQIDVGINTLTTDSPAASTWMLINSDQWSSADLERISVDSSGVATYFGLAPATLKVNFSTSIEPASGTNKALRGRILKITAGLRTVTFTNATNLINEVATPRANGDTITFYDTVGTLPVELRKDVVYYVVNKATDSFQVSYTSGGAAVAFTDDGTPVNSYEIATLNGIVGSAVVDAGSPVSMSRFGLISVVTGDEIAVVIQNQTDTIGMDVSTGGMIISD